ncbi:NADPH-dependent FMN reductase [Martelella alba]|uniref:NAD(P)H-dependent oxidoreductase n=1 Tax=Martelella alba TaxID=2590451 RepID=A0ABY2SLK9_9HYPH|nr:NAD(P)H-dependent oxidoreductase [Martelella alba]TKI06078.1 NAD(P)H-dependent oxidoreductase [Martelella alba]
MCSTGTRAASLANRAAIETQRPPLALLVMGSVRAGRLCPAITRWVADIGCSSTHLAFEPVDLAEWLLPMDDEPAIPAMGRYAQPHTRAWSEKIRSAQAVVFVTPQYNWGYPAVLKNAIDHLYSEWRGKPAAIISYGGHGGEKCAEQLRQVAAALKMAMVATAPALTLDDAVIRQGAPLDPQRDLAAYAGTIRRALSELQKEISSITR